ncbi:hypothetical protein ESB00_17965 [Oleiharenicola lentus]|uniref:Uncharacterized protein n=1 Tax=Oleiharenicola lentus TaxID=2508720 RepID=A0A4Q1C559_9BACT|nr:hypothetical protein [Oleiharenicola lentus]RXK53578.1 hypothetical protein ESB00_17965 [Oleiharenicola lentus]
MIPSRLWCLLIALLLPAALGAGSLESAFQARAMLGPGVWSQVLRLENERPGRGSRYPAEFHGLLVEFQGILWLYTEFDGTQSLSRYAGRTEADRADLAPLLRAVEPGLGRYTAVAGGPPFGTLARPPPYHCFLAAVARWQRLQAEPNPPTRARLLAIYPERARQGHMVLEYWRDGRRYVFDPEHPAKDQELSAKLAEDPLKVALSLYRLDPRPKPVRAMTLELDGA